MKTIFITMADAMTVRNIFRTAFWPEFKKNNPDIKIVVLTTADKKEYYRKTFGGPNVVFESLNPKFKSRYANIVTSLARSGINSHTNLWSKMRSWERGDSGWLVTYLKRLQTFVFGGCNFSKNFLRYLILKINPVPETAAVFEKYKPAMLVATYLPGFDFDVPIAVEAKRQGIKMVGMVRSWDSLSSHGLLRVVPDVFILQSPFLKVMALKYQAINEKKTPIRVIGTPHYDIYPHITTSAGKNSQGNGSRSFGAGVYKNLSSLLLSRQEFFSKMGLDLNKKLALYGAMGDFLFPKEWEIADVFENLIAAGKIKKPTQVVFRAHPKFASPLQRMQNMRYVRSDRKATYLKSENLSSVEIEDEDTRHLINSIYHSDIMVSGASTIVLDALVLEKPVLCIGFDGRDDKSSYWHSVKRFYDCYTHFEAFRETGAAELMHTPDELAQTLNKYFENPPAKEEARRKAIELFIGPYDGRASERLEKALSEEVRKI